MIDAEAKFLKFGNNSASLRHGFQCRGCFAYLIQNLDSGIDIVTGDKVHDRFEILGGRLSPLNPIFLPSWHLCFFALPAFYPVS